MSYIPEGFSVVTLEPTPEEVTQDDWDNAVATNRDDSEFIKNRIPRWADYPTEHASGHDWVTKVNDFGKTVTMRIVTRNRRHPNATMSFSDANLWRAIETQKLRIELFKLMLGSQNLGFTLASGKQKSALFSVALSTEGGEGSDLCIRLASDPERLYYLAVTRLQRTIDMLSRDIEVALRDDISIHEEYWHQIVNAADRPNGQLTGFDPNLVIKRELGSVCPDCNIELSKSGTCFC